MIPLINWREKLWVSNSWIFRFFPIFSNFVFFKAKYFHVIVIFHESIFWVCIFFYFYPTDCSVNAQERKLVLKENTVRNSKKSSWPVTGMRNKGPLKDLNDSKLIVYESKRFPWSPRINFIPFRIFRGPLFHKPVTGQELFFAVSYSKLALIEIIWLYFEVLIDQMNRTKVFSSFSA